VREWSSVTVGRGGIRPGVGPYFGLQDLKGLWGRQGGPDRDPGPMTQPGREMVMQQTGGWHKTHGERGCPRTLRRTAGLRTMLTGVVKLHGPRTISRNHLAEWVQLVTEVVLSAGFFACYSVEHPLYTGGPSRLLF